MHGCTQDLIAQTWQRTSKASEAGLEPLHSTTTWWRTLQCPTLQQAGPKNIHIRHKTLWVTYFYSCLFLTPPGTPVVFVLPLQDPLLHACRRKDVVVNLAVPSSYLFCALLTTRNPPIWETIFRTLRCCSRMYLAHTTPWETALSVQHAVLHLHVSQPIPAPAQHPLGWPSHSHRSYRHFDLWDDRQNAPVIVPWFLQPSLSLSLPGIDDVWWFQSTTLKPHESSHSIP